MTSKSALRRVKNPEVAAVLAASEANKGSVYERLLALVEALQRATQDPSFTRLPSERILVEQFGTTRTTLRESLARIEGQGLIYRSNRRGWFLAPGRFRLDLNRKANFMAMAQEQGRNAATRVADLRRIRSDSEIKTRLQMSGNASILQITRARALDQRWLMVEYMYVKLADYPGIEKLDLSVSLTSLLKDEYGVDVVRESTRILAVGLPEEAAQLLETSPGAPCLEVNRTRYGRDGDVVDYDVEYWLHNAIELVGVGT